MSINFDDFQEALEQAISAIVSLKEEAQSIRDEMETIVDACETIEDEL